MIVKIWQNSNVNVNEQPVKVLLNPNVQVSALKPSYPDANTPLADDDKFIVRQGNDWREVDIGELKQKQQFIYDFGGLWNTHTDKYTTPSLYSSGIRGTNESNNTANSPAEVLLISSIKGYVIHKRGLKVVKVVGNVYYAFNEPYTFYVGRKHYDSAGNLTAEIIDERNITLPHNARWQYDVNSNVEFELGDEIIFFIKYQGTKSSNNLYEFLSQIIMEV